MGNVTIKDIAQAAGVSQATVSRVVNNSAGVTPQRRERVLKAIEEYGYYPNQVARGLKLDSTHTIAMLVADGNNEYFGQIVKAIEDAIRPRSYTLFLSNTLSDQETERSYLQLLAEKKVDGFVINATGFNSEYITQLSRHIPTVLLHRRVPQPEFKGDFVDADFANAAYTLTCNLIQNGHKRIGLICGPTMLSSHRERYFNFQRAMKTIGVDVDKDYLYYCEGRLTPEFGYASCKRLLSMPEPPSALVISHSDTTIGALRYFRDHGIRIPQDISFVSPCDVLLSDLLYVRPTYAMPDTWALGRRAGEMLLERIVSGNEMVNREVLYTPQIIYGDSVRSLLGLPGDKIQPA